MRLAIKRFNDVTGPLFMLLRNQDPARDAAIEEAIITAASRFLSVIDSKGGFCVDEKISLADLHCPPILYRPDVGLAHWRGFSVRGVNSRIGELLDTVTAMPEWQSGLVSDDGIIANCEFPANSETWDASGTGLGGRGRSAG
jgi:hypothetical protein